MAEQVREETREEGRTMSELIIRYDIPMPEDGSVEGRVTGEVALH